MFTLSMPPGFPFARDTNLSATAMATTSADHGLSKVDGRKTIQPGAVPVTSDDPTVPSQAVSSSRQRFSDLFTIFCAGFALISDGYQNSLMTMTNVLFGQLYGKKYTSALSTQVSNALLVGEIIGQLTIG
jgi:hypothetical protein